MPDALAELLQKILLGQERAEKRAEEQAAAQKESDEKQERAEKQMERAEKEASLLAALTALRGLASPATLAHLGHQYMETLELLGNVRVLEPCEGPSILTLQQQAELTALAAVGGAPEATIVRYMAPHLRALEAAPQKVGCVAELYEVKSKALGLEAFGKQCLYHQCIPGHFKSALINQEYCWLLETMHSHPVRLLKMQWTTPGSVCELQRFMGAPAASHA
jgi:hypothetical protein